MDGKYRIEFPRGLILYERLLRVEHWTGKFGSMPPLKPRPVLIPMRLQSSLLSAKRKVGILG